MLQRHPLSLAIVLSSLALVACNSNDDDNVNLPSKAVTTTTITVTPSLGKILNGRVALKNAKTGAILAPTQTLTPTSNGTAKFTVPVSKLADPVLAEVLPTAAGIVEYFDEALEANKTITVPAADIAKPILRAAVSVTANANIGVTALTEAAVQQAAKQASGLIAQNINNANAAVKNALNLNFDITQAPIVVGYGEFDKLINAALDAQRRAYATYLATLAKEAQRINGASATPAYDMARAFADDFSHDGVFNAVGSQALAINYSNAFLTNWIKWVENFYASFAQLSNIISFNRWYGGFNITNKNSVTTYLDAVPIRTVDGVEEYACSGEGRIKSSQGASIYIDFVNQRSANISTYWLNGSGIREGYNAVGGRNGGPITASGHFNQQTFTTHPWLVTDNTGTCVAIYRPVTATKKTLTFNTDGTMIGGNNPVEGNTDTCATLGVNPSTLAAIEDFVGNYEVTASGVAKSNFQVMANGDISLKGQTAQFKEVCKNPTQNNGQGYRLITTKATILLFRQTDNALLAEGKDFANTSAGVFEGYKIVSTDPLKPIRTINGVEEYRCDSWTKIPNGTADGTPIISFGNNLGANTSLTLFGLNSIQKTTTIFTGIQNGATRQQSALKNQFIRVETGGGECLGVFKAITNTDKTLTFKTTGVEVTDTNQNVTTLAASGTATGTITNVQYNKNGTVTGGRGELRANTYEFSGDLTTSYTLKVIDTIQNLRYDLISTNGKFTAINLYSLANSASPLFVYTCDTTGDSTCLDKVSFTQGTKPTLVFNDMKIRGVFQPQFDSIINGQVTLNP